MIEISLAFVIGVGLGMLGTGMYMFFSARAARERRRLEATRAQDRQGNWREEAAREWQWVVASERREGLPILTGDEADEWEVDLDQGGGLGQAPTQRPFNWEDAPDPPTDWSPPTGPPR